MQAHEAISEGALVLSAIVLAASFPHRALIHPQPMAAPGPAVPARSASCPAQPAAAPAEKPAAAPAEKTQAKASAHSSRREGREKQTHERTIVVSLEDRRLALVEDGRVKAVYTVAVGKDATPSPTGSFTIVERVENPTYYHDGKVIPPGPDNPVGDRWMGLSRAGYGIHGTNAPRSIGKAASHGCIRMSRHDLESLFAQVRTGDTVEIVGERDAGTIALFGAPVVPGTAATVPAKAGPQPAVEAVSERPAAEQPAAEQPAAAQPGLTAAAEPAAMQLGQ